MMSLDRRRRAPDCPGLRAGRLHPGRPRGVRWPGPGSGAGSITLDGHGWGHGRGMGQFGAYGYAVDHGWSGPMILDHFYGGTITNQRGRAPPAGAPHR